MFQRWKNALFTATELPTHPQQNAIEIKTIFEATTASVSSDGRISSPSYKEQQYSNIEKKFEERLRDIEEELKKLAKIMEPQQ